MGNGTVSQSDKARVIEALRTHQLNTIGELRRVERILAQIGTPDVTEPMTAAWQHYVNSHTLLTEIRALTRNYPFNSDCLDEAKRRVYSDPASNRSWNLCWLVLQKVKCDNLIPYYAGHQAAMPSMWGGKTPTSDGVQQLAIAFAAEWIWAIDEMLRFWEEPPCR